MMEIPIPSLTIPSPFGPKQWVILETLCSQRTESSTKSFLGIMSFRFLFLFQQKFRFLQARPLPNSFTFRRHFGSEIQGQIFSMTLLSTFLAVGYERTASAQFIYFIWFSILTPLFRQAPSSDSVHSEHYTRSSILIPSTRVSGG